MDKNSNFSKNYSDENIGNRGLRKSGALFFSGGKQSAATRARSSGYEELCPSGNIQNVKIETEKHPFEDIHTVSLYLDPQRHARIL